MPKLTPAQNILLRQLRAAGSAGIPISKCHDSTLAGLVRRGLATISFGTAYLRPEVGPDDDFTPPAAA